MALLGDAWKDVLSEEHRECLTSAFAFVTADFFPDYVDVVGGEGAAANTMLCEHLPPQYAARYDAAFMRRFFVTLQAVGVKLALPEPPQPLVSSVAEALALHVLVRHAAETLESDRDQEGAGEDVRAVGARTSVHIVCATAATSMRWQSTGW